MSPRSLLAACLSLAFALSPVAADTVFVLEADTWSRPRSAETLVGMPPLREAVRLLQGDEDRRLAIRHPDSEQGELWAAELRDWLAALGIPSARVNVAADAAVHDELELVIRP
ncbi:hypothetical protein B1C78_05855 [Thioalkalivibrio denitrificans]|uniref:Uncharacterized protein n=1 Tax=Thioalkalivibrio denitrificans TaxID=108003 RepID=A0A1V3NLG4_9GAMM|nr:hypothetical protein [Thioalkalivibrio denitrificans]OOG25891.1 hypothetical protein B1C78_05855 [Thioalkalivibrio denitrificans]